MRSITGWCLMLVDSERILLLVHWRSSFVDIQPRSVMSTDRSKAVNTSSVHVIDRPCLVFCLSVLQIHVVPYVG